MSCSPFDSFDLYRGTIPGDLTAGSYGLCLQTGLAGSPSPLDPALPPPGEAFFYLLAGRLGTLEGALGFTSAGSLRSNLSPCP